MREACSKMNEAAPSRSSPGLFVTPASSVRASVKRRMHKMFVRGSRNQSAHLARGRLSPTPMLVLESVESNSRNWATDINTELNRRCHLPLSLNESRPLGDAPASVQPQTRSPYTPAPMLDGDDITLDSNRVISESLKQKRLSQDINQLMKPSAASTPVVMLPTPDIRSLLSLSVVETSDGASAASLDDDQVSMLSVAFGALRSFGTPLTPNGTNYDLPEVVKEVARRLSEKEGARKDSIVDSGTASAGSLEMEVAEDMDVDMD